MHRALSFPITALLFAVSALAHPIHSSYTEADYRPDTNRLEFAIRLFTDDAETALSQHAGKKVTVDATPRKELDALVFAYVRARFTIKTRDGTDAALTWVGRELKDSDQHLWVYVQCTVPGGLAGARVRDRLLRETFSDQINSVRVRDHATTPARQVTLLFTNDAEQVVVFSK